MVAVMFFTFACPIKHYPALYNDLPGISATRVLRNVTDGFSVEATDIDPIVHLSLRDIF